MTDLVNQLWNAIKSGDAQAVLAVLGVIITGTMPIWSKLIGNSFSKWKERYNATKNQLDSVVSKYNEMMIKSDQLMSQLEYFVNNNDEANKQISETFKYVIEHSTLTDEEKAYAKSVLETKLVEAPVVTAIENSKTDNSSVQTSTEADNGETPIGL